MTQKDKLRESFLALVSIRSTAKIKKENIEIKNNKVIVLASFTTTDYINMFHTDYGE